MRYSYPYLGMIFDSIKPKPITISAHLGNPG
jgi:hypothetical protein